MSNAPIHIRPERGAKDRKRFLSLPYQIYKRSPDYVPPLRSVEAALMNQKKNPFFLHADAQHFLAWRGNQVVGRIASIENRRHNEIHGDRVGFFGFFDVVAFRDGEVATALLRAAQAWCEDRGLAPMRGPVNYSTNDSCGVLVNGFGEPPAILMPYNRPDYDLLVTGAGLVGVKDLISYWCPTSLPLPPRFKRVIDRQLDRKDIVIRPVDTKNFDVEIKTIRDLYNRSWEKNWGFVPTTDAEFDHAAKDLKLLIDPNMSGVAERKGIPVGFSVFLRDINRILHSGRGRLFPLMWAKLLLGIKHVRRTRCVLLGVVPEARGSAIAEALITRGLLGGRASKIAGAECGWVLEDNTKMRAGIETIGGMITKRYRLYETVTREDEKPETSAGIA